MSWPQIAVILALGYVLRCVRPLRAIAEWWHYSNIHSRYARRHDADILRAGRLAKGALRDCSVLMPRGPENEMVNKSGATRPKVTRTGVAL